MCSFIFPTNYLFKVKELLKIHKPLPSAIIYNLLRPIDIGERTVEKDACIPVFSVGSCNLIETKINQALLYVSGNVILTKSKTFFCWISDSPNTTQFKTFNYSNHFSDRFF